MEKLYAGIGREIITPPVGTPLFGYRPDVISQSVNDDLTVTAFALSYKDQKILLISATVCLFENELSDRIRKAAGEAAGVPGSNVILSATHTHSGPCTSGLIGWGGINWEYVDNILVPRTVSAAKQASLSQKPALFGIASIESNVGINRRQLNPDGSVVLGQNPWGTYDPEMTVVSFIHEESNKQIGSIIHYGAHCTAAGANLEISRDWAGPMLDTLERISGAPAAFFNGCEGDVGPRLSNGQTVGDLRYVNELGQIAASDAVKAWRSIKEYRTVPLGVIKDEVKIPYAPIMPIEEAKARLAQFGGIVPEYNEPHMRYHMYEAIIEEHENGRLAPDYFSFSQTIVTIGPLAIVPFPFEFFSEISLRLRSYSPYQHTLCFGCTNGSNNYLPTQDQLCRGGYEVIMFKYSHIYALRDDSDTIIINENLRLLFNQ